MSHVGVANKIVFCIYSDISDCTFHALVAREWNWNVEAAVHKEKDHPMLQ